MRFDYRLSRKARTCASRLPQRLQQRLAQHLELICDDPYSSAVSKPLQGRLAGMRSSRVGAYRILYYVDDEVRVVDVTDIGPRGDVYKDA